MIWGTKQWVINSEAINGSHLSITSVKVSFKAVGDATASTSDNKMNVDTDDTMNFLRKKNRKTYIKLQLRLQPTNKQI